MLRFLEMFGARIASAIAVSRTACNQFDMPVQKDDVQTTAQATTFSTVWKWRRVAAR